MLQVKGVFSQYEEKVSVLRNITMSAMSHETTCVLGSNGAGKTTLVKTIVNLVRPRVGQIIFEGRRIDREKTHKIVRMGMGVVPEARQLFPNLTVAETLRIGAYCENERSIIDRRAESTFEIFPVLKNRLMQLAGTLSGGEQGILSIARALMANPKMILMDEPSLGLAPMLVERVFRAVRDINKRGLTILLIEQNAVKSLGISSYGYILQKGQIVAEGNTGVLKANEIVKRAYLRG